jgi:hypothetical protein
MTGAPLRRAYLSGGNRLCRERPKNLLDARGAAPFATVAAAEKRLTAGRAGNRRDRS